ncbi:MAG: TetR/AcrR family transcriptional regulator [Pseudolysinimonas sp.]
MSNHPRRRGRPTGETGADLLAVARGVFLERGFAGTTMAEVAARARISKASLYREHPSKDALYAAVVSGWAAAGRDAMRPALERLIEGAAIADDLATFARTLRSGVLSPEVLSMRRLVSSEAVSNPEVAALYFAESWQRNIDALADAFRALDKAQRLSIPDARIAAEQFTWLTVGAPLNQMLLTNTSQPATADDLPASIALFLTNYNTQAQRLP